MERNKETVMEAIDFVKNNIFGKIITWSSYGYTSLIISTILDDDIWKHTAHYSRWYPDPKKYRGDFLAMNNLCNYLLRSIGDFESYLIDEKLLKEIGKELPDIEKELVSVFKLIERLK